MNTEKAVILLSGGLDSTTCLAVAISQGYDCHTLSFYYGQNHSIELDAAESIARRYDVPNRVIDIDLRNGWGGSALTDDMFDIPKGRDADGMGDEVAITYVPGRNTIFLAFALSYAEAIGAKAIFIGVNALDYSGYPDCRPEYIEAFEAMGQLGTKAGDIQIMSPLIRMTKGEIIMLGLSQGVDYSNTISCYDPHSSGRPCGECDSCVLRARGFAEAGHSDPLLARHASLLAKQAINDGE